MSVTAVALRELHRIHQQLADLRERLDRGPKQVRAREAHSSALDAELAKGQAELKAARVAADQKQLLLKSGEVKIEDLRKKLNACGSNREYQTLLEQIAADEMAKSVLEDEILEAYGRIESHLGVIAETQQKIAKAKEELAKVQGVVRDQQEGLLVDVRRLEGELKIAEAKLPEEFMQTYARVVKSKGSDALAQVEGESCGGCFQKLTPNVLNSLSMSRAIFCQTCGRLMYLPEDRAPGRK